FLIVAGMIVSPMLFRLAKGTRNVSELAMLLKVGARIPMITIPGSLLALLSGTALVWYVGYSFAGVWISAAYALWIANFLIAGGVIRPHVEKGPALVERIRASGAGESDELQAFVTDGRTFAAARLIDLFTFVILVLMVFKPGA